uniref:Uncharacterized protein n=1 Tax=Setaria viridis TaxID=4556 RepID=A0A4U6UJP1_SETVI|nr:hypothetical protein SEVIR_5G299901v2 [Setaria viridis]
MHSLTKLVSRAPLSLPTVDCSVKVNGDGNAEASSRPPALHYVVNFRAGSIFILKQCKTFGK